MRLRIARKLAFTIGTSRESAYSPGKIENALRRFERYTHRGWPELRPLLRSITPEMVARHAMEYGRADVALRVLVEAQGGIRE